MSRPEMDESVAERLLEIEASLAGEDPAEAEALLAALEAEAPEEPELHFLRGHARLLAEDADGASKAFGRTIELDPEHAEAWYELATLRAAAGDEAGQREALVRVRALDEAADKDAEWLTDEGRAQIAAFAEEALTRLPAQFRDRLSNVAVVIDDRPPEDIVREGFDPRALGLFEGPDDFQQRAVDASVIPTRIVLFAANLLSDFFHPELLRREVEITVLHEIGHYFGLDEDEVEALGLA